VRAAEVQLTQAKGGLVRYQARQAEAEAALDAAQIKQHRAELALAEVERLEKLGGANPGHVGVARDELGATRALVRVEQNKLAELWAVDPELDLRLAQLRFDGAEARLRSARLDADEHVLRAPADGRVLRVHVREGDLAGPTAPRPAVWLAPAGGWVVRAEVPQEFADRVREGLAVQVEDETGGTALARGRVASVSDWFLPRRQFDPLPTGVNTGLTLECVVELDGGQDRLRFGQRVRVRVLAEQP
jgi:HlyD family secretion protein